MESNLSLSVSRPIPPLWASIFMPSYAIILGFVFTVGILGNLLVIYVVGRFASMQTVTNIYLMSLAVADTLYLLSIPFVIFKIMNNMGFTIGIFFCRLFWFLGTVNWFAGTFTLTALSADRFLAIIYPIVTKRIRTPFYTSIMVIVIWSLSICLMVPAFINAKIKSRPIHNGSHWFCVQNWSNSSKTQMVAFTMYTFTFGYLIPCLLIIFFYSKIIYRLRTVGPNKKSKEKKESQRKTTRLVLAVILVYVFCWLPYWSHQLSMISSWRRIVNSQSESQALTNSTTNKTLASTNGSAKKFGVIIAFSFQLLGYINSAVNPVLYSFMSVNFRKSFMKVFFCKCFTICNGPTEAITRDHVGPNGTYSKQPHQTINKDSGIISADLRMVTYQTTTYGVQAKNLEETVELMNTTSVFLERETGQSPQETAID